MIVVTLRRCDRQVKSQMHHIETSQSHLYPRIENADPFPVAAHLGDEAPVAGVLLVGVMSFRVLEVKRVRGMPLCASRPPSLTSCFGGRLYGVVRLALP